MKFGNLRQLVAKQDAERSEQTTDYGTRNGQVDIDIALMLPTKAHLSKAARDI